MITRWKTGRSAVSAAGNRRQAEETTMLINKKYLAQALLMAGVMMSSFTHAASAPDLTFRATAGPVSGQLQDGFTLGKGRIMHRDAHSGFRVWSEQPLSGVVPGHFILQGRQDPQRQLRVRLEQKQARPDSEKGNGIIIRSGDETLFFSVVVDGNQKVAADQYQVALKAGVITP